MSQMTYSHLPKRTIGNHASITCTLEFQINGGGGENNLGIETIGRCKKLKIIVSLVKHVSFYIYSKIIFNILSIFQETIKGGGRVGIKI